MLLSVYSSRYLCCALCKRAEKKLAALAHQFPISAGKKRLSQDSQLFIACQKYVQKVFGC